MIAEAWDAAGLYQVGSFIGDSWREWNGRFRDDLRSFFRADNGSLQSFADRLLGSHNVYGHKQREAEQSVNFVTCHDGFTLNDLVSYNQKHNESNFEDNHDGSNDNRSWNCGVEGPTTCPTIENLRNQQAKNFMTATLLSLGLPMFVMGDEVRRTQYGNNNAYCHDDQSTWFDWSLLARHADMHRFVKMLIARRVLRATKPEDLRLPLTELLRRGITGWHGVRSNQPDWSSDSHSVALSAVLAEEQLAVYLAFNAYWEALEFELPFIDTTHECPWRRWIDTFLKAPEDIVEWQAALLVHEQKYRMGPRSVAVFWRDIALKQTHDQTKCLRLDP
jgi:glycogen operon protein